MSNLNYSKVVLILVIVVLVIAITGTINNNTIDNTTEVPPYQYLVVNNYYSQSESNVNPIYTGELDVTHPLGDVDVVSIITNLAISNNIDPKLMLAFAALESGLNPKAINKVTQAKGLFQFTPNTWEFIIDRFKLEGMDNPLDPVQNAEVGVYWIKDLMKLVESKTGIKDPGIESIYMMHLLGRTGGLKFHQMKDNELPVHKMSRAVKYNSPLFMKNNEWLTKAEVLVHVNQILYSKLKEFGI